MRDEQSVAKIKARLRQTWFIWYAYFVIEFVSGVGLAMKLIHKSTDYGFDLPVGYGWIATGFLIAFILFIGHGWWCQMAGDLDEG